MMGTFRICLYKLGNNAGYFVTRQTSNIDYTPPFSKIKYKKRYNLHNILLTPGAEALPII